MLHARRIFTPVSLALALCASCVVHVGEDEMQWGGGPVIRESGVTVTELRETGEFSSVQLDSFGDVTVTVAPDRVVRVIADENVAPYIRTRVENGRLIVDHEPGDYSIRGDVRVEVRTPQLDGVTIHGAGDIEVENLQADAFEARILGAGDITASGKCDRLTASISGAGDLKLYGLVARTADVHIDGAGDAKVHAHESLKAVLSGAGDVRYRGRPAVESTISGAGSIRHD